MAKKSNQKQKKKMSLRKRIVLLIVEVVVLVLALAGAYFANIWGKVGKEEKLTEKTANVNEDISSETVDLMTTGYTTIALFGLDNRESGNYNTGNSDTIMIASINNDTGDVRLVSVYRDTLMAVEDGSKSKYRKANYAYSNGGANAAVAMLNANLDLNITEYVCVDWLALVEVIDDLGGLDLTLTKEEVKWTNFNLIEVDNLTGNTTKDLVGSGELHLDGTQALCYARIRKTAGDDFLRASRQRIVLQAMLDKAKTADIGELTSIVNHVADDISTTFTLPEIIELASRVKTYSIGATSGFPTVLACKGVNIDGRDIGDTVIPCTMEANVSELHKFLFDEEAYVTSESVKEISKKIGAYTGLKKPEDSNYNTDAFNNTIGASGTYFKEENKKKSESDTTGTEVQQGAGGSKTTETKKKQ